MNTEAQCNQNTDSESAVDPQRTPLHGPGTGSDQEPNPGLSSSSRCTVRPRASPRSSANLKISDGHNGGGRLGWAWLGVTMTRTRDWR